jgi:hypothetical protein
MLSGGCGCENFNFSALYGTGDAEDASGSVGLSNPEKLRKL